MKNGVNWGYGFAVGDANTRIFITFKTDFYQMHGSSCFQGCFQFFF